MDSDTAINKYQFVFPANRVLSKQIIESGNDEFLDSISQSILFSQTTIVNVDNIFFNKSKLFFKLRVPSSVIPFNTSVNEYQYNFAYDTSSHNLISLDRIVPDSSSAFLPVMDETSKVRGLVFYKNNFYSYMSSLNLFSAKEITASKHPKYPIVLQKYFSTQSRKSNPVTVKMKLKD